MIQSRMCLILQGEKLCRYVKGEFRRRRSILPPPDTLAHEGDGSTKILGLVRRAMQHDSIQDVLDFTGREVVSVCVGCIWTTSFFM